MEATLGLARGIQCVDCGQTLYSLAFDFLPDQRWHAICIGCHNRYQIAPDGAYYLESRAS